MSSKEKIKKQGMLMFNWICLRLPIDKVWNEHLAEYYAPKNFNFWYFFGSLAEIGRASCRERV